MTFRFSLEKVLEIKLEELESLENAERRVRADIQSLEGRLSKLRDAYFDDRDELNDHIRSSDLAGAKIYEMSLEDKKQQMMDLLRGLNELRQALEVISAKALQLRKKTSSLEKLRDRKRLEYDKRVEAKLQNEIDNRSALAVWNRNRSQRSL